MEKGAKTRLFRFLADTGQGIKYQEIVSLLKDKSIYSESQCHRVAAAYFANQNGFPESYAKLLTDDDRQLAAALGDYRATYEINTEVRQTRERKEIKAAKQDESWESLFDKIDPRKRAPEIDQVRFAANYVDTNPADIDPEDVPCRGALSLVKRMARNDTFYQNIATQVLSRLLPDKKQLEYESKFQDDGREDLERLEEFERLFQNSSNQTC